MKKIFILEFEWIKKNLFEVELRIVWSHFKTHKVFYEN